MRICYLGNAASIHVLRWANYFAEHNWEVDLITWHSPAKGIKIHQDVAIHRIFSPPHSLARYGALIEIAYLMRKIRPDIIHAHYLSHFGILGGLYSQLFGFRPVVLTAWGSDILYEAKGWRRKLIRHALKRADLITCEAEILKKALVGLGADSKKINHILWVPDTKNFNPEQRSEKLREELGIFDSPAIISSKKLKTIYDIESLVKCIPLVLKEVPEAIFVIAEEGFQMKRLKKLAEDLGVSGRIRWIGLIPSDEFPKYMASADIYVCTSLSDGGFALSTKEAMACGLPVVVTDFGDNRKWVEDGVNGFVIPLKNPGVLAAKIVYLLQNEDKRRDFGRANRQLMEEKNNWQQEMGKMEKLYNELLQRYRK